MLVAFEQILLSGLLFGQNTGILRFGHRFQTQKFQYFSNVLWLSITISAITFTAGLTALWVLYESTYLSQNDVYLYLVIFLSTTLLSLQELYLVFARVNGLSNEYVIVRLCFQVLKFASILIFGYLHFEEWSYPSGQILTCILSVSLCVYFFKRDFQGAKFRHRSIIRRAMLRFGLPFFLHSLIGIMYTVIDRYMIDFYLGKENVGIYSFSYSIGNSTFFLINIFALAYLPEIYKEKSFTLVAQKKLRSMILKCMGLVSLASIVIYFVFPPIVSRLYPAYIAGLPVIGIVLIATCCHPIYLYGLYKLTLQKNTRSVPIVTVISLTLNVLLNTLLIPNQGVIGAAYATLISEICFGILMIGASNGSLFLKTKKMRDMYK